MLLLEPYLLYLIMSYFVVVNKCSSEVPKAYNFVVVVVVVDVIVVVVVVLALLVVADHTIFSCQQ